jgi:hypothetical protein
LFIFLELFQPCASNSRSKIFFSMAGQELSLVALPVQEKTAFFLRGFPLLSGLIYKKPLKANKHFYT